MKRKAIAIAFTVTLLTFGLGLSQANATGCSTSTDVTAPGSCDVTAQVQIATATTLHFTQVNGSFGNRLPGTTSPCQTIAAGTVTTNASSATLTITKSAGNAAGFTGGSMFRYDTNPGDCTSLVDGDTGVTSLASLHYTSSGGSFTTGAKVVLDAAQVPGTYSQTLTYSIATP